MASDPSSSTRSKERESLQSGDSWMEASREPSLPRLAPLGWPVAAPLRSNLTISYFYYFSDLGPVSLVTSPSCMQVLPPRASRTHRCAGLKRDAWGRWGSVGDTEASLGGEGGAAERDILGVLVAPPTLTSALGPCPTPNLGLDSAALDAAVAQQGPHFLGQVAWDGLLPFTSAPWPGSLRHW